MEETTLSPEIIHAFRMLLTFSVPLMIIAGIGLGLFLYRKNKNMRKRYSERKWFKLR
jgi:hypothetical protein